MDTAKFWRRLFGVRFEKGVFIRTTEPIQHREWTVPVGVKGKICHSWPIANGEVVYFILMEARVRFMDKPQTFLAKKEQIEPVDD